MKVSSSLAAVNPTNRYRYEVPARGTVVGITLYLGLSAWMAYLAKGYAEMPRVGFIALSVIFAALAVVVLIRRLAFPCMLELTDDAILLPRGHPWPRIATIPYADIVRIVDHGDSLTLATGKGSFEIGANWLEGYPAVREIISAKTAIALPGYEKPEPLRWTGFPPKPDWPSLRSDEFPRPLVHWVEAEDWTRYRLRAEISKPVLYQLRSELWFFVRCYAFCCAFIVLPCVGFLLLPWLFSLGPFQLLTISIPPFLAVSVLAIFITMLHWFYGIGLVRPNAKISFRDRGITNQLPNGQQWDRTYRQLCAWTVIEREFKGRILQILLLRLVKGRVCSQAIALPDAGVRDQVVQILNDKQVPHAPDLKPSWEAE
ncbi:MAG: hypothetical protein ACLQLG_03880 [Thermoguttaceae bacterium]